MVETSTPNGNHTVLENKQTLQKLTESDPILQKKKILPGDVMHLKKDEREALEQRVSKLFNTLKGDELDALYDRVEALLPSEGKTDLKNQLWEKNHMDIIRVISNFVNRHGQIPTKNTIAEESGLSRQTIHKHLVSFSESENYKQEKLKLKVLTSSALAHVYQAACLGNVKAARLFFEMTGELGNRNTNNFFIQINNIRLDENLIKQLPQSAILEIESIITKSIPQQLNKQNESAT